MMQIEISTKIPKFEHYGLITSESLNLLSANLLNFIQAKYASSSDGVVTGFEISYDKIENVFKISRGILKIDNKIFYINDELNLNIPSVEGRYTCIAKLNSKITKTYYDNILTLELINTADYKGEFLLFEIIIRQGAKISDEIETFEEYRDEYNTIDIINQKYSVSHSKVSTISPIILKKWAYLASHKLKISQIDLNFIFLCFNSVVSKELIIAYIENKLGISIDVSCDNKELIKKLANILRNNNKIDVKEIKENDECFYLE
ncbi:hypothetical protein [uncultured Sneathia sp.]|uniref:hypothetical protein n=1 Tax=uncultured Sneathia sp. TaxID=278067 RepID=UPI002805243A|nr:hypothetical protein [uncultured Sneathia sp.]